MKHLVLIVLLAISLVAVNSADAKFFSPAWGYGVNAGGARGDNANGHEEWQPYVGGHMQTALLPLLNGQIGVSYSQLHATGSAGYYTNTIQVDGRLSLCLFRMPEAFPYLYAGFGFAKDQRRNGTKWLPVIPAGVGIQSPLSQNLLLAVNGGYNLALSDDLDHHVRTVNTNQFTSQKQDGYWGLTVGLVFGGRKTDKPDQAAAVEVNDKDTDNDGLSDKDEKTYGTNPKIADTDGDTLNDGDEVHKYRTDPLKPDTDMDGLTDGNEVTIYHSDPIKADTDGDLLNDGAEVTQYKTNPVKTDTDTDGLTDNDEVNKYRTDALKTDSENDGLSDGDEIIKFQSDPSKPDSDSDGIKDGDEVNKFKTDPSKSDTEGDGLSDGDEVNKYRTNALMVDTDEGGMNDGAEIKANKNPLDPKDDLFELVSGKKIVLRGINFDTNKSKVLPESEWILEKARASMVAYPDVTVVISGHTDSVGSDDANRTLSQKRAQSVKDWLEAKGIPSDRMKVVGKGETEPMSSNDTEDGRAENRRMEFAVE